MNPLDNIHVVLVGTLYTGNVGSSCRAMANMGIHHLRLAAPNIQNSWEEGERMAVHATDIMNSRKEFASLEEAVADCVAVVGTTAREGLYRQHVKAPRDCAADILALAEMGPVALVFGREDKGLLNEEVAQCTHLVRIPVDAGYTSINLAQAVLITCYEVFCASGRYEPPREKAPPAPQAQKMQLMKNWSQMLCEIGFMKPIQADHFMQGFHRVFSRGVYSKDDAALLLGVARQAIWTARRAAGGPPAEPETDTREHA